MLRHLGSRWGGTGMASLNGPPEEVTPLAKFPRTCAAGTREGPTQMRAWVGATVKAWGEHGVTRLREAPLLGSECLVQVPRDRETCSQCAMVLRNLVNEC